MCLVRRVLLCNKPCTHMATSQADVEHSINGQYCESSQYWFHNDHHELSRLAHTSSRNFFLACMERAPH